MLHAETLHSTHQIHATSHHRGFKKASEIAIKQGRARLMMEDTIHKAEQKLKVKRETAVQQSGNSAAIDVPASFLLTTEEMSKIYNESGCEESRKLVRDCFSVPTANQFRSIDSSCNNVYNPLQGASDTTFRRLLNPVYEDGVSSLRGSRQANDVKSSFVQPNPSARLISTTIVSDGLKSETPYSHLLMQFGQFLDHDLDLAPEIEFECEGCNFTNVCSPIRVKDDDPKFGKGTSRDGKCLEFRRSVAVCSTNTPGTFLPREQMNVLTSYIDGSMVYGSNQEQAHALRAFKDGLLKVGPVIGDGDSLPIDNPNHPIVSCPGRNPKDCFLCGDVRCNEQVSLTVIHTLWVREHNRLARELKLLNPIWSDERIYQETRKIVGAMIQKIVYHDYLPKVLGPQMLDILIGKYRGYDKFVDASIPNSFATAAFRFGHSLILPKFPRLAPDYSIAQPALELREMFFNPSQYAASNGVGPIARGWVGVNSRHIDEFLSEVLTSQLFQQKNVGPAMDLASLNIQRHRDHGLPTYGAWKKFCSDLFPALRPFAFNNQTSEMLLENLHGEKEKSELWVAGLAEKKVPGSLVGPTFACIFGLTFKNLREGDRFYFEKGGVFTQNQLEQIKKSSFSRIMCDNTDTQTVQLDAFLTNLTTVNCNALPKVSLDAWKEINCFVHVQAPVGQLIAGRSRLSYSGMPAKTFGSKKNSLQRCLPVICPTARSHLRLTIFSLPKQAQCTYTTSGTFTSTNKDTTVFHRNYICSGNPHIFTSLAACEQSKHPSIAFSCTQQSAKAEISFPTTADPESSEYNGGLPGYVVKEIKRDILTSNHYRSRYRYRHRYSK